MNAKNRISARPSKSGLTNINLHALAADLSSPTNRLEGALSGRLVVTRADTRDWRTLDGFGHARLRDGLIWDIPMFGLLSPVLERRLAGAGQQPCDGCDGGLFITNGVIYSNPLEINTTMTRLEYTGTVDLWENVKARVTAELLHNLPGIGPLISPFLWPVGKLFEYQVTRTLKDPKKEPVHDVSKLLLFPVIPSAPSRISFPASAVSSVPPTRRRREIDVLPGAPPSRRRINLEIFPAKHAGGTPALQFLFRRDALQREFQFQNLPAAFRAGEKVFRKFTVFDHFIEDAFALIQV